MRVFHSTQHSGYHTTQFPSNVLRVATYNIHKGVRGVGPRRRLEIHNLVPVSYTHLTLPTTPYV